jgi:hypothetical protein
MASSRQIDYSCVSKEFFRHATSAEIVKTIDHAAQRSGLDRGRVFDDFLTATICALSGGRMEEEYLRTIKPYIAGKSGERAVDLFPQMLGTIVDAMSETRADILGDVFEGAITYGQNGQFFTPDPICQLMAQLTDDGRNTGVVCDPCCGSGRTLLAAAQLNRNREFVGQDIDLRCVRITAINLALWNLYGWVIHGNSLALEKKLVYRTGFDGRGVVREVDPAACPFPVVPSDSPPAAELPAGPTDPNAGQGGQRSLFD